MARKIICDRCGKECTGTHGTLELNRTQSTAQSEPVGYDHFDILDLCDICTEVARTTFGFKISQQHLKEIEQLSWGPPDVRPHDVGYLHGGTADERAFVAEQLEADPDLRARIISPDVRPQP